jgi:hypothetical protein
MEAAMRPGHGCVPDRVPLMCQLSLGHYFLHAGLDPIDVWHDGRAFAEALVTLRRRYDFDGILVNLPGRDPEWRRHIARIDDTAAGRAIIWTSGAITVVPRDDNPRVSPAPSTRGPSPAIDALDPEQLFYVEPHDLGGVSYPCRWSFSSDAAVPGPEFFPAWHWDTLAFVRAAAPDASVHGEVFSPFSQLMELVGSTNALVGLLRRPVQVRAVLDRLADGAIALARGHFEHGADAVLVSSAFAGGGFISPDHYRAFVLPCERKVIDGIRAAFPGQPVYTHTCGAIGDRLELMVETGTDGIDTLDPPPLGTVDLADAKRRLGPRVFIKGNLDPVNTLLRDTPNACYAAAAERLAIAKPGGGYILSSACSVPPATPPANIAALHRAVEERGYYEA